MRRKAIHNSSFLFALLLLTTLFTAATGKIIYVDSEATAEFDGSSWEHAYRTLQDAIAEVRPGDEIRVANGIYRPDRRSSLVIARGGGEPPVEASGDRAATFELINGVTFMGGYAGYGETDPNARNISLYETILSGDLNNNDLPEDVLNESSRADNSYNVITTRGNAVLDGFTITGGNANIANTPQSPLSDGINGAGLINEYGTIEITNCIFRENSTYQLGGAIYNHRGSLNLTNCTFIRNLARDNGAGIYNFQSDMNLKNCTFRDNLAQFGSGGGIYNEQSNPNLTNCKFIENIANYGGGMYNDDSSPVLNQCSFIKNSSYSSGDGGGIYNQKSVSTFNKCIFIGNSAHNNGGAMFNKESNPDLNNCALIGNSAFDYGGALCNNNSSPAFTNCTFSANSAPNGNAIACNSQQSIMKNTIAFFNCILWNGGSEIWDNNSARFLFSYCNVQSELRGLRGEGSIHEDPLFIDPLGPDNIPGTEDDDLRLAPDSPCIDSGDPNYVPVPNETDLDGNRRIIRARIDMGAYEFHPIIYVDDDNRLETQQGSEINYLLEDGTEQHPFNNISKAIDAAEDGYTILVKPGRYGRIDFMGKAITIAGIEGTAIIEHATGGRSQSAVTFHTGEGPDSVLKNFIIKNSDIAISLNYGAKPTIRNLTIVNNILGIAAYENSDPDISNCIFWNNIDGDLYQCQACYSCIEHWSDLKNIIGESSIQGNISVNPLFVDAANDDYHLKSEGWRWNINSESWTYDNTTSRCIDAGDPDSPLADEPMSIPRDPNNIYGINQRINMGAFGGTAQASMPPYNWSITDDLTPPEPNPSQWAADGEPKEAYGGPGEYDYLAQMTAQQATDNSGIVEYFFECTTEPAYSSGWQSSNMYSVTVGRSGQNHQFRFKTRDFYGNETAWSEELPAELAPRQQPAPKFFLIVY